MDELLLEYAPPATPESDGRLRLSYSAMDTYENCSLKYRFRYIDKIETRRGPILGFGSFLHEALYRWYNQPVPVPPPVEGLLGYLNDAWDSSAFSSAKEEKLYRDHARAVLTAYHQTNVASFRIPVALEQRFEIDVDGVSFVGAIDRMDRHPDGSYEIIDYKTSRRLPPLKYVERDLQLSVYYLAAWEIWGIRPDRLTLYFLLPGQPLTTTRTAADLPALRDRIARVADSIRSGEFAPRENALCNWCDFRAKCPLFAHEAARAAGTAPVAIGDVVDEWIERRRSLRADAARLEELSSTIHAYCDEQGLERLHGASGAAVTRVARTESTYDPGLVRAALPPELLERVLRMDDAAVAQLISDGIDGDLRARLEEARIDQTMFALSLKELRRR
jgi:putative RecB family exonuclease